MSSTLHVIVPWAGHGAQFRACEGALVKRFLTTASLDGLDPSCVDQREPEFEID